MRRSLTLLLALLLSACQLAPARAPAPVLHDLGAPPAAGDGLALPWRLEIRVAAPAWLDDGAVHYRRTGQTRLAAYRDHRWAAAPSALLASRIGALLAAPPAAAASRGLEIDLHALEQQLPTDGSARAMLLARVTLSARTRDAILASRDFRFETRCPSADVTGGVAAQAAALDTLAREIATWLATVASAEAGR